MRRTRHELADLADFTCGSARKCGVARSSGIGRIFPAIGPEWSLERCLPASEMDADEKQKFCRSSIESRVARGSIIFKTNATNTSAYYRRKESLSLERESTLRLRAADDGRAQLAGGAFAKLNHPDARATHRRRATCRRGERCCLVQSACRLSSTPDHSVPSQAPVRASWMSA